MSFSIDQLPSLMEASQGLVPSSRAFQGGLGLMQVYQQLFSQKGLLKLSAPSAFIKKFKLSLDFHSSIIYLNSLAEGGHFLLLYKHFFPEEFAASTAPFAPLPGADHITDGAGVYSPREIEFFNLVGNRLFPFNFDWMMEIASTDGERVNNIFIEYMGFDQDDPDYDECRLGWQLLAIINTPSYFEDLCEQISGVPGHAAFLEVLNKVKEGELDQLQFKERCKKARVGGGVLAYLPLAFEVISNDTDNYFLDGSPSNPIDEFYWSGGINTIKYLAAEYDEALLKTHQCGILMDWIEESPANFRKVITLWNRSLTKPQPQQESNAPLVELLTADQVRIRV